MIDVVDPVGMATLQDLGRPGYAHIGVPPSGAVDRPALMLANRLVGNPPGDAAIEMTGHGAILRFRRASTAALTGALVSAHLSSGRVAATGAPFHIAAGEALTVGRLLSGCRVYLAVRGGIEAPLTLGSCSTDLMSGLGPTPLSAGDSLHVGRGSRPWPAADLAPAAAPTRPALLTLHLGPDVDGFEATSIHRLVSEAFSVSNDSNRVAVRLRGSPVRWAAADQVPTQALVIGAVQVPPSGDPIVFLNDHPTTGGYPIVGVVATSDLPVVAQLRPGDHVRFRGATA